MPPKNSSRRLEQPQARDNGDMLSDKDRCWIEFRDAQNAKFEAERVSLEAEREAQEARLHDEWLAERQASLERRPAVDHRRPAPSTTSAPTVEVAVVSAEPDPMRCLLGASIGLWIIHRISGWP